MTFSFPKSLKTPILWLPKLLLFTLLLQGCGYQFGQGSLPCRYQTICIPYVLGDKTGDFTATLVNEVSRSGAFHYRRCNAQLILKVALLDYFDENIGFNYDRVKDGEREDSIIPIETRITALAEISVVESCSGCTVLGPARLTASVDFDHDYYFGSDDANNLSLGQLTDIDVAFDSVLDPLNRILAEKIVDYVINSW